MTDAIRESRRQYVDLFAGLMRQACDTYQVLPAELWGGYRKRKTKQVSARIWIVDRLREQVRYVGIHSQPDGWRYVFVGEDEFESAKPISLPLSCGSVGLDSAAYLAHKRRIKHIDNQSKPNGTETSITTQ